MPFNYGGRLCLSGGLRDLCKRLHKGFMSPLEGSIETSRVVGTGCCNPSICLCLFNDASVDQGLGQHRTTAEMACSHKE